MSALEIVLSIATVSSIGWIALTSAARLAFNTVIPIILHAAGTVSIRGVADLLLLILCYSWLATVSDLVSTIKGTPAHSLGLNVSSSTHKRKCNVPGLQE
jgi:hypothetical protein